MSMPQIWDLASQLAADETDELDLVIEEARVQQESTVALTQRIRGQSSVRLECVSGSRVTGRVALVTDDAVLVLDQGGQCLVMLPAVTALAVPRRAPGPGPTLADRGGMRSAVRRWSGRSVVVRLRTGGMVRGDLAEAGRDYIGISAAAETVLVPFNALEWVRTGEC